MKNILVSALVALTLAGCTPAEPVVTPKPSASAYSEPVVTADSKAPVSFPREPVEVIPAPVVTEEPVEVPSVPAEPVTPVELPNVPVETVEPIAEPVEQPVSVPEPVEVAEPVETITETVEPAPGHWGHAALASHGLYANIEVVDAVSVCRIATGSGGCAYVGSGTIMMSADLGPDWRGLHVLFHEYAHAVRGITDECEAEAYAHSKTQNIVWSYPNCA